MGKVMRSRQRNLFGEKCTELLARGNLAQKDLAQGIFLSPSHVSRMLHGNRLPDRERVLTILHWFQAQGVLIHKVEADELLLSANYTPLLDGEMQFDKPIFTKDPRSSQNTQVNVGPFRKQSIPASNQSAFSIRRRVNVIGIVLIFILTFGGLNFFRPSLFQSRVEQKNAPCQEFSNLAQKGWESISATWEKVSDTAFVMTENNPDEPFGKVESEVLTVNLDRCSLLVAGVTNVGIGTGFTFQLLDKSTTSQNEVLTDIIVADQDGTYAFDLKQADIWDGGGVQTFTLNIWVSGEGESVTISKLLIRDQ